MPVRRRSPFKLLDAHRPGPFSTRLWHNLKTTHGLAPRSPVALRFAWCLTLAPLQKATSPCERRTSSEDALDKRSAIRYTSHSCMWMLKTILGLPRTSPREPLDPSCAFAKGSSARRQKCQFGDARPSNSSMPIAQAPSRQDSGTT